MPDKQTSELPSIIQRFKEIEAKIEAAAGKSGKLARAYAERGSLRSEIGADEEGLKDLLRAHALRYHRLDNGLRLEKLSDASLPELLDSYYTWEQELARKGGHVPSTDWSPDAELGEAFRIYARDSLLSLAPECPDAQVQALVDTALASIRCFERALQNLELVPSSASTSDVVRRMRAWIYAHRAAANTLLYWMRRSSKDVVLKDPVAESLFRDADKGFTLAIEEVPQYPWALRFKAFLLALRGGPRGAAQMSDYRRARNLLRRVDGDSLPQDIQSSLDRARAMLLSYDVSDVDSRRYEKDSALAIEPDGEDAAEQTIEAAYRATKRDHDEFLSPYYAALGTWYLARNAEKDKEFYQDALASAIRSAQVRARNAFSQALATLASLEDLQELEGVSNDRTFRDLLLQGSQFGLDNEARAIFIRDPLSQFILHSDRPDLAKQREAIRERFAIPKAITDKLSSSGIGSSTYSTSPQTGARHDAHAE